MENIDALLQSKVKVDTATNKGSVIGLLEVLTGQTRSNCHNIFQRLTTTNPEVSTKCRRLKINGRGYEEPVADAATLVEIVFVCGGKKARNFRRAAAETLCRLLRGDLTLVDEIQQRHVEVQGTDLETFLAGPEEDLDEAMDIQEKDAPTDIQPAVTAGDLTGVPQDAPTDIHSEEERSLVSSERHLAISERQSELSERRKQQVSEEIALSERYQQAVTAELALSARREQQRRQDIALSERQLQLRREELDLAEKYQQQHERAMQTRAQWVPQCQHYLEMSREKTDLLQRSTDLRYDSLRAEYVPSPEEFTFFDACALTATDLMAQHQEYAEPFDVWTFCAQPVWFCRQVGGVQTYGAYKQRPQPLWFYVPKKLAIGYVRRAGTGTEMVNYYENRPGRKEQMAAFIMRHIKLSEGKQHAFSPPYGIDICSDLL